jgi:hypothetical protein
MSYEKGTVINISSVNKPMRGQVIVEDVYDGVTLYSLANDTDIPVQRNINYHCLFLLMGKLNVYTRDRLSIKESKEIFGGQAIVLPLNEPVGSTVLDDSVAVEVTLGRKIDGDKVHSMEPFRPRDMVRYQPGRAVQETIFTSGFVVFNICALDMNTEMNGLKGTGEQILTGLEGEGIICYKGKEFVMHAGENFRVEHDVEYGLKTVNTQFKVSQLIHVE